MAEIIRCYREMVPAMRFIGRKYDAFTDWGACFESDVFGAVERAMGGVEAIRALWKDGGGYVGLERRCDGEPFAYYIGMFAPPDTPVPDGLCGVDFCEAHLGVCWVYGDGSYDRDACAAHLADAASSRSGMHRARCGRSRTAPVHGIPLPTKRETSLQITFFM